MTSQGESTAVKTRPILFSGPMVRAILDGRKTQTRRIVKDSHFKHLGLERDGEIVYTCEGPQWNGEFEGGEVPWCPFGSVGMRLWVRETWAVHGVLYDDLKPSDIHTSTPRGCWEDGDSIWFAADGVNPNAWQGKCEWQQRGKWRPSIHMPRWASRITLEITGVRVECAHQITNDDVLAEGIEQIHIDKWKKWLHPNDVHGHAFGELWDSINGAGSWAENPYVWVIAFKKVAQ